MHGAPGPREYAVERSGRARIERDARRAHTRMPQRTAPAQHFFADRHADAFLKFEAHQRHVVVKHVRGAGDISAAISLHDFNQDLRIRETGHGAGGPGHELFEKKYAAEPAENTDFEAL